jgi:hypothetical protein
MLGSPTSVRPLRNRESPATFCSPTYRSKEIASKAAYLHSIHRHASSGTNVSIILGFFLMEGNLLLGMDKSQLSCGLFHNDGNIYATQCRVLGREINWKGSERKQWCYNLGLSYKLYRGTYQNHEKHENMCRRVTDMPTCPEHNLQYQIIKSKSKLYYDRQSVG